MFRDRRLRVLARWGLVLSLVAALLTVFPLAVLAGDCYSGSYYYRQTYTPTYYQQQTVKVVKEYVPVAAAYQPPDYYYSLGSYYQQKLTEDAAAWRALQTLKQMQQYQPPQQYAPPQGYQAPQAPMQPQYQPPAQQQAPAPQYQPQQQMPKAPAPRQAGYNAEALKGVLSASCLHCHGGQSKDRADLSNPDAVPPALRFECWARAARGDMPKGHQRLPKEQVDPMYWWAMSAMQAHR